MQTAGLRNAGLAGWPHPQLPLGRHARRLCV